MNNEQKVNGLRNAQDGFTLLEMLFVFFLVGLLVGLIAPRFGPRLDHMERVSQMQDLEDQLRQLPRRVRLAGRNIELPKDLGMTDLGDGAPVLNVPQGWTISFDPALMIAANGACSATSLAIVLGATDETTARYSIADLSCELSPLAH
jgi:type II secretory pathway pseudopilin PulG